MYLKYKDVDDDDNDDDFVKGLEFFLIIAEKITQPMILISFQK